MEISWEPLSLNWPFGPRESFLSFSLPICKMDQQFLPLGMLLGSKEALARKGFGHPSGSLMGEGGFQYQWEFTEPPFLVLRNGSGA